MRSWHSWNSTSTNYKCFTILIQKKTLKFLSVWCVSISLRWLFTTECSAITMRIVSWQKMKYTQDGKEIEGIVIGLTLSVVDHKPLQKMSCHIDRSITIQNLSGKRYYRIEVVKIALGHQFVVERREVLFMRINISELRKDFQNELIQYVVNFYIKNNKFHRRRKRKKFTWVGIVKKTLWVLLSWVEIRSSSRVSKSAWWRPNTSYFWESKQRETTIFMWIGIA